MGQGGGFYPGRLISTSWISNTFQKIQSLLTPDEVYEDDLARNYYLIVELILGLGEVLATGMPWQRDFEATRCKLKEQENRIFNLIHELVF